jgi:hypothetical protein
MQGHYYFPRLAATMLLSLCLFTACRQEDKAVQPAAEQVAKLTFLTETLDNEQASEDDRKKAGELMSGLTFEEMESLIDLRHQHYLKTGIVDAQRAAYLLELRHSLNRKAFELKGKPFHQLDFANSEEVIRTSKWNKDNPKAGAPANPSARTTGECTLTSNPPCTAWRDNGFIGIDAFVSRDKEITGTYFGVRTYQCSDGKYQDDCDYVFVYDYSKLYKHYAWKPTAGIAVITGGAAAKLTDNNPNKIDCGTYSLQILYGKTRIDFAFTTPLNAVTYLKLVLERSIECRVCYTGTWGSEKWYSWGIRDESQDGWGANGGWQDGFYPCACTVDNYVVR